MPYLLARSDLAPLLTDPACIRESLTVVERALCASRAGEVAWLQFPLGNRSGRLNVQLESRAGEGTYVRCFPAGNEGGDRREGPGAPTVPGLVFDVDGGLRAVLSLEDLNPWRTAAPVAVAVRALAPGGAESLALLGSGRQAAATLRAVRQALPSLARVVVASRTPEHRDAFVRAAGAEGGPDVEAADSAEAAAADADVVCVAAPGIRIDPARLRERVLVTTVLPGSVTEGGGVRRVVPVRRRPESRATGWDPPHGPPPGGAGPGEEALADLLGSAHGGGTGGRPPAGRVVYEQRGQFGCDLALLVWASSAALAAGRGTWIEMT